MVKKDEATKRCAAKGSEELYSALLSKLRRALPAIVQEPTPKSSNSSATPSDDDKIDFTKAQELFRRRQAGENLSKEDEAYLHKARAARNRQLAGQAWQRMKAPAAREKTGMKPLMEMSEDDCYQGEEGGLYGKGQNVPPRTITERRKRRSPALSRSTRRESPLPRDGLVLSRFQCRTRRRNFRDFCASPTRTRASRAW